MTQTIQVSPDLLPHPIGDMKCIRCWPGFPVRCKCGGLIHADWGDESYDGDYFLYYACDKCGGEYVHE